MQMMAAGVPFVVPPEFLRVQWTRLPGALPTPEFVAQMKRLLNAPRIPTEVDGGLATQPPANHPRQPTAMTSPALASTSRVPAKAGIAAAAIIVAGIAATYFATRKAAPASPPAASSVGATVKSPAPRCAPTRASSRC